MRRAHRDLPDEDPMLACAGLAAHADAVFQDAWLRMVNATASFRPQGATVDQAFGRAAGAQRLALPLETAGSGPRHALKKLRGCMGDDRLPLGAAR